MIAGLALAASAGLLAASAPILPASPQDVAASAETPPRSELLVAAAATLRAPGHDSTTLRAGAGARVAIPVGFGALGLYHAADVGVPRRAFFASGPVASLTQLQGLPSATYPQPVYVLSTASGTRISVWGFFNGVPPDAILASRMAADLAASDTPLMVFDPTFTPSREAGYTRYLLK